MNFPSHTDEVVNCKAWNQCPPTRAVDLTSQSNFNGIAHLRAQRSQSALEDYTPGEPPDVSIDSAMEIPSLVERSPEADGNANLDHQKNIVKQVESSHSVGVNSDPAHPVNSESFFRRIFHVLTKFSKFIGPGFMVSVAYIDPGNYSTDVAAGASERFRLLFIVLLSNMFAIVLQSLAIRLGSVTGLNLAEHCRLHLPKWLNIALYILAEAAIIATDIAEVIGSAIALNLLLHIPLVAGCALTLVDVLLILLFYSPSGSMRRLRAFELFIVLLVLAVVVCFCIQLSLITNTPVGEVFKGYLPSSAIVSGQGLYLSCGILGATVMPHSLYLGSGIVQPRLQAFDTKVELRISNSNESLPAFEPDAAHQVFEATHNRHIVNDESHKAPYRPSLAAIKSCLNYSVAELALSLSLFALFVNSAILIVAGASLSNNPSAPSADLFGIHDLLSSTLAPAAGTIFALALLLSGTSAGIICTIAGQMVSEGALNWSLAPWLRRLLTRSISITPSIIIAAAVGREGLSAALNGTQVALSVILPFVTAPLIYFTCRNKYMTVRTRDPGSGRNGDPGTGEEGVGMRNHWAMTVVSMGVWLVITVMNVALLVLLGLGKA